MTHIFCDNNNRISCLMLVSFGNDRLNKLMKKKKRINPIN